MRTYDITPKVQLHFPTLKEQNDMYLKRNRELIATLREKEANKEMFIREYFKVIGAVEDLALFSTAPNAMTPQELADHTGLKSVARLESVQDLKNAKQVLYDIAAELFSLIAFLDAPILKGKPKV